MKHTLAAIAGTFLFTTALFVLCGSRGTGSGALTMTQDGGGAYTVLKDGTPLMRLRLGDGNELLSFKLEADGRFTASANIADDFLSIEAKSPRIDSGITANLSAENLAVYAQNADERGVIVNSGEEYLLYQLVSGAYRTLVSTDLSDDSDGLSVHHEWIPSGTSAVTHSGYEVGKDGSTSPLTEDVTLTGRVEQRAQPAPDGAEPEPYYVLVLDAPCATRVRTQEPVTELPVGNTAPGDQARLSRMSAAGTPCTVSGTIVSRRLMLTPDGSKEPFPPSDAAIYLRLQ